MLIYFILLLVVTLLVYLSQKATGRAARVVLYGLAIASLALVSGIRAAGVGTDSGYYARVFGPANSLSDVTSAGIEPGVPFLSLLSKSVYNDYAVMFALVGIVVASCFLLGVHRLSVEPGVSTFVLLASGTFYFSFNGMRQGIAAAFVFLAFGFIYYRQFWAFAACIAAAALFHLSALIALPAYFIVPRENDFKYNAFIFGAVLVATLFFGEAVTLAGRLNPKYLAYGESVGRNAGLAYQAFIALVGLFFLYFRRHVQEHLALYDVLLNLYLLGILVTAVSFARATFVSGLLRMNIYFISSQILLWPIVFANLRSHRHVDLLRAAFVAIFLAYHAVYISRFSNLTPYRFNPIVPAWISGLL
jgi:hypothetical protein